MKKTFKSKETFGAYNDACAWLKENGYSYGSMCSSSPTAIMKGDWDISKWWNLSNEERANIHGTITSKSKGSGYRDGPVIVEIY